MVDIEKKDTSETVKVIVRCRPMNKREKDLNSTKCVSLEEGTGQVTIMKNDETLDTGKPFTFDSVFDTESTQTAVYTATAEPLVEAVMEGYNGTVFAYGQTGCGKSFSMMGVPADPTLMGIIPRAFQQIFDTIAANEVPDKKYLVQGCYIEIYNEEVRDLLSSNHTARLELKEHPEKGVYIAGVSHHTVDGVEEITKLMEQGTANRSVGATLMNADSSRSHSIFIVQVESSQPSEAGEVVRQGVLNLVDLAGSERQGKTGATGQRLKEAAKINMSLSALGNVISALVAGKPHIPYRDSKLTRLLQNSLGGNSKTVMVAAVSPAQDNYEETLSTLRYANRAKQIKNKPKINEDPRDAMLREYQDEITRLRELLQQSGVSAGGVGGLDGVKATLIEQTRGALQQLDAEGAAGEAETRRQQHQLTMETAEQQAQLEAVAAQRREVELLRADVQRREQELAQCGGVEDETVRLELAAEKARLEEEMLVEREAQAALEQALREREEEGERIKRQLAHEQAERGRKQAELQSQLSALEHEHSAARRQLEAQLAQMERKLMKGGARAQQDKAAAVARLNKLRRAREQSEQERAALEQHARQLQQEVADTQEQQSVQARELHELRRQVQLLQSELEDARDEHAADEADAAKTTRELTKELWLYKTIVRSTVDPEAIRAAMAAARYDERTGRWTLQQSAGNITKPTPPSGSGAGAQAYRNKMYSRPIAPSGPAPMGLGLGRTRGLADTEAASPQPLEQRADNGWKKSIRGDFPPVAALTPTASAGSTLGRPKTMRPPAPAPDVDMHELNNLPRRPGFRPNLADSDASHGSRPGSVTPREPALDHMRPRQGFVPAAQPGSRTGSAKGSAQPDTVDLLATMQRRPGFSPAGI